MQKQETGYQCLLYKKNQLQNWQMVLEKKKPTVQRPELITDHGTWSGLNAVKNS